MAEAEASRAKGLAEAQVTAAKGQAEADAMAKKAEAYKQYNEAAVTQMIIDKLPELVQAAASPLAKVGNITLLSTGGDTTGASKISGDVLNVAAQSLTMIKGLTGIDLAESMRRKAGTVIDNHVEQAPPRQPVPTLPQPPVRPPQQPGQN
jgi:flotillin